MSAGCRTKHGWSIRAYSIQQFSGLTVQRFGSLAWASVVTGPAAVSLHALLVLLATQVLTRYRADAAAGPANDSFTNRAPITGTNTTVTGSNTGAGRETGEPRHGGNNGGKSVWWRWTAPTNGDVVITTDGSDFDTLLGTYTGSTLSTLQLVAGNDDHGIQVTSRVRFQATQDIEYQIAVDGYNDGTNVDSGSITLSLVCVCEPIVRPPNDNFANRTVLSGLALVTNVSNVEATREAGEPLHSAKMGDTSVWWTWTAPLTGPVTVSTATSTFDTLLALYKGDSLANLVEVAGSDDQDPDAGILTSLVTFNATAGDTFQIAVDGFDGASGQISLHLDSVLVSLSDPQSLLDGSFQFILAGPVGRTCQIEATAGLDAWTSVATLVNTNGTMVVTDSLATNFSQRLYRALLKP